MKKIVLSLALAVASALALPAWAQQAGEGPVRARDNADVTSYLQRQWQKIDARAPRRIATASGDGTTIIGNVLQSYTWTEAPGLYKFAATAGTTLTPLVTNSNLNGKGGGVYFDDIFHYANYMSYYGMISGYYGEYATSDGGASWTETKPYSYVDNGGNIVGMCATYDELSGAVYVLGTEGNTLKTVDYSAVTKNDIGTLDSSFVSIVCSPTTGQLYGLSLHGCLCKIDKSNAKVTELVGFTGLSSTYGYYSYQPLAFDPNTGKLYWAYNGTSGEGHGLYTIDLTSGEASFITSFGTTAEMGSIFIPKKAAESGAPAKATNLSATFTAPSLTGTFSFTAPTKSYGGATLDANSSLTYNIMVNGTTAFTGSVMPGATITKDITAAQSGTLNIVVTTANSAGVSPQAKYTTRVGYDNPKPVTNATLTISDDGRAIVTWSPSTAVVNGGYQTDFTYTVVRNPDADTVATGLTTTTFSEQLPETELRYWSYTVIPVNGDAKGVAATTEKKLYGSAFEIPFNYNFNTDSATMCVFAKDGDVSWTFTKAYGVGDFPVAQCASWNDPTSAWLLTPPMRFSADKVYTFSFGYYCNYDSKNTPAILGVSYGKGSDPANYTPVDTITYGGMSNYKFKRANYTIHVPQDGDYRIGFGALGTGGVYMYVDSMRVMEGVSELAPDSVTMLRAKDVPGEDTLTISFKAPTRTIAGAPLSSISKINILRSDSLIHTFSAVQPGEALSYTDVVPKAGTYEYEIVAFNAEAGEGLTARASFPVGDDIPYGASGARLKDNLDGTFTLSWNPPAVTNKGINGRYINPDHLRYAIIDVDHNQAGDYLVENVEGTSYTQQMDTVGEQKQYWAAVHAQTEAGKSVDNANAFTSWPLYTGRAFSLPVHESFADGKEHGYFYDLRYDIYNPTTALSADDEGGAWTNYNQLWMNLDLMKVNVEHAKHPRLSFSYFAQKSRIEQNIDVVVYANGEKERADSVLHIDYTKINDVNGHWERVCIPLDFLQGCKYFTANFAGRHVGNDDNPANAPISVDAFDIYDAPERDLAIAASGPKSVNAGHKAKINVSVRNRGQNTSGAFTIRLLDDADSVVATATGSNLSVEKDSVVGLTYTARAAQTGTVSLRAIVDYDGDSNLSNNTDTVTLEVNPTNFAPVSEVTATADHNSVTVNWTEPASTGRDVFESFEDYEPFVIDGIGDWTVNDGDGEYVSGFADFVYPNRFMPMAWQVFAPSAINNAAQQDAATGDQYVVSFCPGQGTAADDWLISPKLNGEEQTISYKAKLYTTQYGNETLEALYSETPNPEDFQLVATHRVTSTDWTLLNFDVPEGANYFALHHTTKDGFAVCVDDVVYKSGEEKITGYNIYVDGRYVATTDADSREYRIPYLEDGNHVVAVSVVYGDNESVLVETQVVTVINGVVADSFGDADMIVYSTAGAVVARGKNALSRLPKGTYVVRTAKGIRHIKL